jgi:hypothetical protein
VEGEADDDAEGDGVVVGRVADDESDGGEPAGKTDGDDSEEELSCLPPRPRPLPLPPIEGEATWGSCGDWCWWYCFCGLLGIWRGFGDDA